MTMRLLQSGWLIMVLSVALVAAAPAAERSRTVAEMGNLTGVDFKEGTPHEHRLESGGAALRFDEPFNFRIDLKSKAVEPEDFDLVKLEVKADRGAFMRVAVENHPQKIGDISY